MAFNEQSGYKAVRLVADGLVDGGKPIRRLHAIEVLSTAGGAAHPVWYDGPDATDPTKKRGGVSVSAASTWAAITDLGQQLSKMYVDFDANTAEVVVTFQPAE